MKFLLPSFLILAITSCLSFAQTIHSSLPKNIDKSGWYMFYLHGRIVEEQGTGAIHPQFGAYEYLAILDTLNSKGFHVISEVRAKNTDEKLYAEKVSSQIDTLLRAGVKAEHVFILGASKGAFITLLVSVFTKNTKINFIVLGTCSEQVTSSLGANETNLHGNFLSIYEVSDTYASSCNSFIPKQKGVIGFEEIALKMNNGHGFLYKPYHEWVAPMILWANKK